MHYNIERHEEIDSTSTRAKELARLGAPAGTVVLANRQSAGRGRLGRTFVSNAGGIYMSIIFRTDLPAADAVRITSFAAVCVAEAIDELFGTECKIKWVNDIFLEDKKVCGILTESGFSGGRDIPDFTVVGIGINVDKTCFPEEISSTAGTISDFSSQKASKNELISRILSNLSPLLSKTIPSDTIRKYRARSYILGKEVYVAGNEELCGRAIEISDDGSLIIELPNGKDLTLSSGEVSIRLS